MKKFISALIVLSVILSMSTFTFVYSAEEVLISDSFEDKLTGWSYASDYAKSNIQVATDSAADGKKSLLFNDDSDAASPNLKSKAFDVKEGDKLVISADFKLVEGSVISVYYKFYDASGKQLSGSGAINSDSKEWKNVTKELTAPAGTTKLQLWITGGVKNLGKCYVDNVKVVRTSAGTSASSSTAPGGISSSAATPKGEVMLSDSFEDKLTGWSYASDYAKSNIQVATDSAADGKKSLLFNDDSDAASPNLKSKAFDVKEGDKLIISADFKMVEGSAISVFYKFYDAAGKQLSGSGAINSDSKEWKNVSKEVTAPAGTTKLQLWLTGGVKNLGKCYIDNVKIIRTSNGAGTAASSTPSSSTATGEAPKPIDIPQGEVVFTENFEADKLPWSFSNITDGTSITVVTNNVQEGKKAIYLVDDSDAKSPIAKSTTVDVKGGEAFSINGYVKNVKGDVMKIWYKFFDASGKQIGSGNVGATGTEWQGVQKNVVAPEGSTKLQIWLTGGNANISSAYIDNIVVVKIPAEVVEASKPKELISKPEVVEGIPTDSDKFHIYLCIGQSNMVGADKVQPEDIVKIDGAYLLNSSGNWETAQPYTTSKSGGEYMGLNRYSTVASGTGRMGPTISFARGMATKVPEGVKIGIISNAKGGTTIEQWSKGFEKTASRADLDLYENAIKRTKEALAKGGVLKGIFWLQGESCALRDGYIEKLVPVANGIREEIGVKHSEVPFFVTEVPHVRAAAVANLQTAPQFIENCYVISSKDLTIFDSIHFDFTSQRKLGLRYAEMALDKVYGIAASADAMYTEIYGAPQEEKVDNTVYTILVNGKKLESDVPPVMAGDRLFVPIRVIFESLGAVVSWDDPTQTVTGVRGDRTVKMQIGDEHMTVNGVTTAMGIAPMLKDSRTLVPIRFVGEGLGAEVGWDEKTNTASITL